MKRLLQQMICLVLISGLAQDINTHSPGMQEMINQNNAGFQEFEVIRSKSAIGAGIFGMAGQKIPLPLIESFKSGGGAVLIIEEDFIERCPNDRHAKSGINMWVMHLDEANPYNSFITSKKDKKASLQIRGMMDRYEPGPNFCEDLEMVKVESGLGALSASFSTYLHTSPRQFQVLEQGVYDGEKMKQLKAVQEFWRANLIGYLNYMKEYKAKPHITRIGGNGTVQPPPPAQREKVKAGTEDGDEEEGWFSERDGFAIAKHALDALSTSIDALELGNNGAKLFGAALKYGGSVKKAALDVVASAANLAGLDISSMSEEHIYKTMDMMVAAFAKNNKQYAERGDNIAQQLDRKAKIPVRDNRFYQEAIDAGQMLYQLNDLFNSLDQVEDELAQLKFPEGAVSGKVYGPKLNQNLTSWKIEGQPIITVANSTALEETKKMASPELLGELKNMGYDIPDEMMNMDIDAMIKKAQAQADGKIDIDLEAPLFNGILSTTHTITVQGNKIQNFLILFAVSSPKEPKEYVWLSDNTIFEGNSTKTDPEKPKSKILYLAVDGSDTNPGTEAAPFATMQRALEEAHVLRSNRSTVVIRVKNGLYRQSADVDWSAAVGLPLLTIEAVNKHQAIFIGSEPVDEAIQWTRNINKETGGWTAPVPLHPQQWFYTAGGNPLENPAPVLNVNGNTLFHLPVLPPQAKGMYSFGNSKVTVGPPEGVSDMNEASIEVSTRKFALKILGGEVITITGLRLQNYPYPAPNNTPGVYHQGNVKVIGCKFQ